jgi:hypothetical protein
LIVKAYAPLFDFGDVQPGRCRSPAARERTGKGQAVAAALTIWSHINNTKFISTGTIRIALSGAKRYTPALTATTKRNKANR